MYAGDAKMSWRSSSRLPQEKQESGALHGFACHQVFTSAGEIWRFTSAGESTKRRQPYTLGKGISIHSVVKTKLAPLIKANCKDQFGIAVGYLTVEATQVKLTKA